MKNIISKSGFALVVEKKSKFLGEAHFAKTPEEAMEFVNAVKKKYFDARHHVYAYICNDGDSVKYSDDGEPQGTAGRPLLDLIVNSQMTNCVIIVTRYFGGTLLGTGGLVRAYTESGKAALEKAEIAHLCMGYEVYLSVSYTQLNELKYIVKNMSLSTDDDMCRLYISNISYTDRCNVTVNCDENLLESFRGNITESFSGTVNAEISDKKLINLKNINDIDFN